ncbi:MAG: TAXI family TRAP transporter solute-binding subunit [Thiohalocapsa sp.]
MSPTPKSAKVRGRLEILALFGGSALFAIAGIVVALQFVQPAPPSHIRIATGNADGAYYRYAERYRAILARNGIELDLVETAGSVDNLKRLLTEDNPVQLALVQGGVASEAQREQLAGLGSLFYEPLWLLVSSGTDARTLNTLAGARIAIGPADSGTRALAERLLAANGIDDANADLVSEDTETSALRLANGELDLVFVVGATDLPLLRELALADRIGLADLPRAAAYARRDRSLTALDLPQGALDLQHDLPATDLNLIAATANLVARQDLHPALINLIIAAAREVHGKGGLLAAPGTFPTPLHSDFLLNADAKRFYKSGPPLLQRWLPFWVATWIDRTKVMLVPLVALLIPLSKVLPPAYRWRIRRRILRWYKELRTIDMELETSELGAERLAQLRRDLDHIETDAAQVEVPLGYSDQLYELRSHIALVQRKLGSLIP